MTVYNESWAQADSLILGPDLTWAKFPAGASLDAGSFPYQSVFAGPDDGETLGGAFAVYGGDRTGLDPAQEAGCYARAEHDVGSSSMYVEATVAAVDPDSSHYPTFYLGVCLDPGYAGPLDNPDSSNDYYDGPSGIWCLIEQNFNFPDSAGGLIYAYNADTDGIQFLSSGQTFGSYFELAALQPGDVLRFSIDAGSGQATVLLNGEPVYSQVIDIALSGLSPPFSLGERGGLGIVSYDEPDTYSAGADEWGAFEAGALSDLPPPEPAPKLRATVFSGTRTNGMLSGLGRELVGGKERQWNEPISEAGLGSVKLLNDRRQPHARDLIRFDIHGQPAWTMIVEELKRVDLAPSGLRIDEHSIWSGRGHLAVMEEGTIWPTLGLNAYPKQLDMHYDWRHPDYDDSDWVTPSSIMPMSQAQGFEPDKITLLTDPNDFWGHSPFLVWSPNFPAGPPPYPDPSILWASSGSSTDAPAGTCYFRHRVTLPFELTYVGWLAGDNRAFAWMDGAEIGGTNQGGTSPDTAGWIDTQQPIWVRCSAGEHLFAVEAENTPRSDSVSGNPAGVGWNFFIPGFPVTLGMCMFSSADSGILMKEYPPEPPGMTVGFAIRLALEQVQARGALTYVTLGFTDERDSAGNLWNVMPCISTKILNDLLILLTEISASYADIRMDPDSFTLRAWNHNQMGSGSVVDLRRDSGNLTSLEQHVSGRIANAVIGSFQDQFLEAVDQGSIDQYGRIEAELHIGSVDNVYEAQRVLDEALAAFARPQEEISATVSKKDAPIGYLHYGHGDRMATTDHLGDNVTERCVGIAVSEDASNGDVITVPSLKQVVA